MNSDDGECLGEVRGPVWAHFPQTPQAAEFSARCVVAQCMIFPSVLYSDCANVVHQSLSLIHISEPTRPEPI
eukprot:1040054-Pyramimonas_sp.AAC.1